MLCMQIYCEVHFRFDAIECNETGSEGESVKPSAPGQVFGSMPSFRRSVPRLRLHVECELYERSKFLFIRCCMCWYNFDITFTVTLEMNSISVPCNICNNQRLKIVNV